MLAMRILDVEIAEGDTVTVGAADGELVRRWCVQIRSRAQQ